MQNRIAELEAAPTTPYLDFSFANASFTRGARLSGTLLILKARVRPQIHRVFAVRVLICATIRHPPSCHDEISTGQADIAHLMQAVTTPREGTGFCRRNGFQRASIASESELQSELNQTRKIDCARDEPES